MKMNPRLFEAFLKCPTKCHLRSVGETGSGNAYADWVRQQNDAYRREAAARLLTGVPEANRASSPPATESFKTAMWRLAVDVEAQTEHIGFVQELSEPVPLVQTGFFEPRRYTHRLTPAGEGAAKNLRAGHPDDVSKVDQALAPIMALRGVDYVQLSIAAKCHLILKRGGLPLLPGAVVEAARRFSWQVTTEQVQGGFQLLQQLGLAPQAPATAATN